VTFYFRSTYVFFMKTRPCGNKRNIVKLTMLSGGIQGGLGWRQQAILHLPGFPRVPRNLRKFRRVAGRKLTQWLLHQKLRLLRFVLKIVRKSQRGQGLKA